MIETIEPENISSEQERWNATAEGVLRRILWQIETGQVKPKELAVAFVDYKGGQKRDVVVIVTDHDQIKMNGLINLAAKRFADTMLYGEN